MRTLVRVLHSEKQLAKKILFVVVSLIIYILLTNYGKYASQEILLIGWLYLTIGQFFTYSIIFDKK